MTETELSEKKPLQQLDVNGLQNANRDDAEWKIAEPDARILSFKKIPSEGGCSFFPTQFNLSKFDHFITL